MQNRRLVRLPKEQLENVMEERNRQLRRETRVKSAPDKLTAQVAANRRRSRGQEEPAPARTAWAAKLGIAR